MSGTKITRRDFLKLFGFATMGLGMGALFGFGRVNPQIAKGTPVTPPNTPPVSRIIGSVVCEPSKVIPGENVVVDVLSTVGESYEKNKDVIVTINGVRGAKQYLQYESPGNYNVLVQASKDGMVETQIASVQVLEPEAAVTTSALSSAGMAIMSLNELSRIGPPLLRVAKSPSQPYNIGFSVGAQNFFTRGLITGPLITKSEQNPLRIPTAIGTSTTVGSGQIAETATSPNFEVIQPHIIPQSLNIRNEYQNLDISPNFEVIQPELLQPQSPNTAKFHWDFGDGTTIMTTEPNIEHDFESVLGPDEEHRNFHVKVRIEQSTGETTELIRTLSVYNAYAMCKHLGNLIPRVSSDGFASRIFLGYQGSFTVENIEDFPLELKTRRILPVLDDGDDSSIPGAEEQLNPTIIVNPHSSLLVSVVTTPGQVPDNAAGFTVCYGGATNQGQQIRVEAYFDIPLSERNKKNVKIGNIAVTHFKPLRDAVLNSPNPPDPASPSTNFRPEGFILNNSIRPSRRIQPFLQRVSIPSAEIGIEPLSQELQTTLGTASQLLSPDINALQTNSTFSEVIESGLLDATLMSNIVPPPPQENAECDPDNVPEDLTDWACQATTEQRQVPVPGRFMNARKGDIILSPGGMGVIGGLLKQVDPPQRYSHCGIMTRNYDQITHSTASEERIEAYPVGTDPSTGDPAATDGHRPDIVKYGWPGVVTQSVEASIHGFTVPDAVKQGGVMLDPETAHLEPKDQKWYSISSFSPHNEFMEINKNWEIVPAMVVKPDPMKETPETRRKLREIANEALAQTGKSHYRFYCYTDPSIGQTSLAPPEAGQWAANTYGSVCSSFLWLMLKKHGVHLESDGHTVTALDFDQKDRDAKAKVRPDTLDGLYTYSAQERLKAAEFLYNYLYNKAHQTAGDIGRALTDAPDDVANQVVNTFAKDWADGDSKNNDDWRNDMKDSNAVSPDNILLWDGPEQNGLYGYAAPLVYREPRIETVTIHRWKKVQTKGILEGTISYQGQAVAGAIVQLYDGMQDFTDENGFYRIENIPVGNYIAKAAKDPDEIVGLYRTGEVPVTIEAGTRTIDIELHGPPDLFRVLKVNGSTHIVDYEDWTDNEVADRPFYRELYVGPFNTHAETTIVEKMGGEVRTEFRIVADWQVDKSINISYNLKFYEGGSDDTDDLDGETGHFFNLQADWWQSWVSEIKSSDAGEVKVEPVFENAINPN